MRLGQLARKYNVSMEEITSYLKEVDPTNDMLHVNSKLDEQTETLVVKHFDLSLEVVSEEIEELNEEPFEESGQEYIEPEVADVEESVEVLPNEAEEPPLEPENQNLSKDDGEVIETDRLLELLESEDSSVDLSKITRIKAPKKELEGLKVVGRIELPEPISKPTEKESKHGRTGKPPRRLVSDEELEKRRLRTKQKKEEYESRQEKRRKEKEKNQKKALKEAHYRQKLQQAKSTKLKHKDKVQVEHTSPEVIEQPPKPKTFFGKIWKWLNT